MIGDSLTDKQTAKKVIFILNILKKLAFAVKSIFKKLN